MGMQASPTESSFALTPRRFKALAVLYFHPCLSARDFAVRYYTEPELDYLFSSVSNQGNGACAGKKAWLCAGSLLGRLRKEGMAYVIPYTNPRKFNLSEKGRDVLLGMEKSIEKLEQFRKSERI